MDRTCYSHTQVNGIECTICFNNYGPAHVPYVLQCGHTFCENCISKSNSCYIDNITIITKNKNYALIELVETMNILFTIPPKNTQNDILLDEFVKVKSNDTILEELMQLYDINVTINFDSIIINENIWKDLMIFLIIKSLHRLEDLSPPDYIDAVWHKLLLMPALCHKIYNIIGAIVDHTPIARENKKQQKRAEEIASTIFLNINWNKYNYKTIFIKLFGTTTIFKILYSPTKNYYNMLLEKCYTIISETYPSINTESIQILNHENILLNNLDSVENEQTLHISLNYETKISWNSINIIRSKNDIIHVQIGSRALISELFTIVSKELKCLIYDLRLIHDHRQLDFLSAKLLTDHNIQDNSNIYVVPRLTGC